MSTTDEATGAPSEPTYTITFEGQSARLEFVRQWDQRVARGCHYLPLTAIYRAGGCPPGKDPESWLAQHAGPLVEGHQRYYQSICNCRACNDPGPVRRRAPRREGWIAEVEAVVPIAFSYSGFVDDARVPTDRGGA